MRIAIPLADEAGTLAEQFSASGSFALYDVHDETRAVSYLGRQKFDQPGCGRSPGFLRQHGVEVVLAHDVSEKAEKFLLEVGIVSIQDAPIMTSDQLIAHLVSGTLQARPPEAQGGCGSGGCGGCCGGGGHSHAQETEAQGCGGHTHGCGAEQSAGQGCCGGHAHADHAHEDAAAH